MLQLALIKVNSSGGEFSMKKTILGIFFILALVTAPCSSIQAEKAEEDTWKNFRYLEGIWEGTGDGMSGISKVTYSFEFLMNKKYLHMRTRSVFKPQEKNPKGEVHEDWGMFSYDTMRKKHVFRQFHVEGFITQYTLESISAQGNFLEFATETIENAPPGMKAKLTFEKRDDKTMELKFFLMMPGRDDFSCLSTNQVTKK